MAPYPSIVVQYVGRDGCYVLNGVRVRCAAGHGEGSLRDEHGRGISTPLASEEDRDTVLSCLSTPEMRGFVESLLAVRLESPEDSP